MSEVKAPVTVIEFRPLKKGDSLQGFLTLELASGLVLHDCSLHQRDDGTRWIGLPAREYTKPDGEKAWARIVDFATKESHSRFQAAAMAALQVTSTSTRKLPCRRHTSGRRRGS